MASSGPRGNDIHPGDPLNSPLYMDVLNGLMPEGGPALSDADVADIYYWIQNGALDDGPPVTTTTTSTVTTTSMVQTTTTTTMGHGTTTTTTTTMPATPMATFQWLNTNIFQPKCAICHDATNPPKGYSMTTYSQIMSRIVPGSSSTSKLYIEVANGSMPQGGSLSSAEKSAIKSWIDSGAPNN